MFKHYLLVNKGLCFEEDVLKYTDKVFKDIFTLKQKINIPCEVLTPSELQTCCINNPENLNLKNKYMTAVYIKEIN